MQLPIFKSTIQELMLMQNKWSSILNAFTKNISLQSSIISKIQLKTGKLNIINHLLGKKLTGWRVIGVTDPAQISDQQASNQTPELTLVLNTTADTTVTLEVF